MRLTLALLLAVAIAVSAYAVVRDDGAAGEGTGPVTLVGDSLNVGIEPYLADELPGRRIEAHDRVGRPTSEGIEELRRLGATLAPVVVVSLGTNDAEGSEAEFRRLVAEAVGIAGPRRCLVWATILRDGTPRDGFNRVLEDAAARADIRLVDWAGMAGKDGSLLAADRVHGTPEGYARRAEETARVVRTCLGDGG